MIFLFIYLFVYFLRLSWQLYAFLTCWLHLATHTKLKNQTLQTEQAMLVPDFLTLLLNSECHILTQMFIKLNGETCVGPAAARSALLLFSVLLRSLCPKAISQGGTLNKTSLELSRQEVRWAEPLSCRTSHRVLIPQQVWLLNDLIITRYSKPIAAKDTFNCKRNVTNAVQMLNYG